MKEYTTHCDIGSALIGNEQWTFAVPNIGGDGEMKVRIYDSDSEFAADKDRSQRMDFLSSAQGRFGLFENDCDFDKLLSGEKTIDDALAILSGRYGVYTGVYSVALVKWHD